MTRCPIRACSIRACLARWCRCCERPWIKTPSAVSRAPRRWAAPYSRYDRICCLDRPHPAHPAPSFQEDSHLPPSSVRPRHRPLLAVWVPGTARISEIRPLSHRCQARPAVPRHPAQAALPLCRPVLDLQRLAVGPTMLPVAGLTIHPTEQITISPPGIPKAASEEEQQALAGRADPTVLQRMPDQGRFLHNRLPGRSAAYSSPLSPQPCCWC